MYTRPIRFHCRNVGDPRAENWPRYLSNDAYVQAVMREIELCDFIVKQLEIPDAMGVVYLLVGDYRHSRLLALDLKGPRGIVFILNDEGWSDPELIKVTPASLAITLSELVVGGNPNADTWLELESHPSSRLSTIRNSTVELGSERAPVYVRRQTDHTFN